MGKRMNVVHELNSEFFYVFFCFVFASSELAKLCRISVDPLTHDSPHTKTFLLMQAHFLHLPLPNSDYLTDTKSVLDQAIRVIQVSVHRIVT